MQPSEATVTSADCALEGNETTITASKAESACLGGGGGSGGADPDPEARIHGGADRLREVRIGAAAARGERRAARPLRGQLDSGRI